MSHTIYICTDNDDDIVNNIISNILNLGVQMAPTSSDNSLHSSQTHNKNSNTSIIAIDCSNFKSEYSNVQLIEIIANTISSYKFYGMIIKSSDGSTAWLSGNMLKNNKSETLSHKIIPTEPEKELKELEKPEEKKEKINNTKDAPDINNLEKTNSDKNDIKIDIDFLISVVKSTINISDIFFAENTKEERMLLALELEKLKTRDLSSPL